MWRLAESLKVLRAQIDALAPHRSKLSDGSIGDARHRSRASDHNPWIHDGSYGVVSAIDITHDPKGGLDAYELAETLRLGRDPRIKYIISNHKIAESKNNFAWRLYNGVNPHNKHTHISVMSNKSLYDSTKPWALLPAMPAHYLIRNGDIGKAVVELQLRLNVPHTGVFDGVTESAVRSFQAKHKLKSDGIVGPKTWEVLEAETQLLDMQAKSIMPT